MNDFTTQELELLASFVCERYDMLVEIANDPKVTSTSFRSGSARDARKIETLNAKLRPHYRGGDAR